LFNIRSKTLNKNVKKLASNHIKRMAAVMKLTEEALLELSAPKFGIKEKKIIEKFGKYEAHLDLTNLKKIKPVWINLETSKESKTVPIEIKKSKKQKLTLFKKKLKEVETAIKVHKNRLENCYLGNPNWEFTEWYNLYVKHPFLSLFKANLIWKFDNQLSLFHLNGEWIDCECKSYDISEHKQVTLWHPLFSSAEEVLAWRKILIENEIIQPFKQAFREIYVVTDAELVTENYSNRFAAHILYQHQFLALARQRNWSYNLQGAWDSHNVPRKQILFHDIKVDYLVEGIEHDTDAGVFQYVSSDQVRFYKNTDLLNMADIPPLVFSEAMRDVDMFVGVSSIGNNPDWTDGGHQDYWHTYSFGELNISAVNRKAIKFILGVVIFL